jgi:hypothetical protein
MDKIVASVSVRDMPEVQARMRLELADLLRSHATSCEPTVADELRQVAVLFETGQRREP